VPPFSTARRTCRAIIRGLRQKPFVLISIVAFAVFAGLLVYAETWSSAWDEGFHVLTALLIRWGKRPYLDFLFPQTALNAYWVAAWMHVFGESWRMIHALATTATAAAMLLTGDYVLRRFPETEWRTPAAIAAIIAVGLNVPVLEFGTLGQAYGFCLLMIVLAFRMAVLSPERSTLLWPLLAGLFGGAGAAGSLLTAPVPVVLLIWILWRDETRSRFVKGAAFVLGGIVPFLPMIWLFIQSPNQVRFNLFDYHFFYRQVEWEGALQHDFEVMIAWIDSSQAFLLGLLALVGVFFAVRTRHWARSLRWELYLCCGLIAALSLHISSAHPTFARYFLFTVPFLSILAVAGLYAVGSRIQTPARPWLVVIVFSVLYSLSTAKAIYGRYDNMTWGDFEQVAKRVGEVTPPNQSLMADEFVYFLLKRQPPSGMELEDSHKLSGFSPAKAAEFHILPRTELNKQVREGKFHTVETCDDADDERIEPLHLPQLYSKKEEVAGCTIYWDWAPRPAATAPKN